MFEGLSSNARLLIVILILAIVAVLVAYTKIGIGAAALVSIVIVGLLIVTRALWAPSGTTRVRLLSLTGIFATGASYGVWAPFLDAYIKQLAESPELSSQYPWLKDISLSSEPSLATLAFTLLGVFVVNYFTRDTTLTGKHPDPIDKEFPRKTYQERLKPFVNHLENRLHTIDRETNWSPNYYTELEADVEVRTLTNSISGRRVTNLLNAMRSDKTTRGFLVLGDPGAGKSVALRKLGREMLKEVAKTDRVPIYVNLREWMPKPDETGKRAWSETNKPTVGNLYDFAVESVKVNADVFIDEFVDEYFKKMWEDGRLFFILDSFDEIPQLLDEGEDSWLNEHLSNIIWTFTSGNPVYRGVLASRFFRRPTDAFQASKILEIRPLSEEKIVHALGRFPRFDEILQRQLFRERNDLVPVARNPFLMALLGEWVTGHGSLPDNQGQIYDSYLRGRLASCKKKLDEKRLRADDLLAAAMKIAWFLFDSKEYGLEAPVSVIADRAGISDPGAVIDILTYARIGRTGTGDSQAFAFVHRRFLEYFTVQKLVTTPELAPVGDIPTDSRGRDALVLYAQVTEPAEAERLARYCWNQITENFESRETRLRAVHCIRFLSDAFRARKECLNSFADDLGEFVKKGVVGDGDLLLAKLCLEATGLLPQEDVEPILRYAIGSRNAWLQETAFKACRHMPRLGIDMEYALIKYILALPIEVFLPALPSLIFSLSLSSQFTNVLKVAKLRRLDVRIFAASSVFSLIFAPLLFAVIFFIEIVAASEILLVEMLFSRKDRTGQSIISFLVSSYRLIVGVSSFFLYYIYFFKLEKNEWINYVFFWGHDNLVVVFLGLAGMFFVAPWIAWYLSLGIFAHKMLGFIKSIFLMKIKSLLLKAVAVFAGVLAWVLFMVLFVQNIQYVVYVVNAILFWGILGVIILWRVCRSVAHTVHDLLIIKKLKFCSRMTRMDIARGLAELKTKWIRKKFIANLYRNKVLAIGEWPEDFSLNSRTDPAITQLARLEEKWLGLDR